MGCLVPGETVISCVICRRFKSTRLEIMYIPGDMCQDLVILGQISRDVEQLSDLFNCHLSPRVTKNNHLSFLPH